MPPSKLGVLIRATRSTLDVSLREFARRIGKSPAFVTELECDGFPSVSEETLRKVAKVLSLDEARLFVLAERTPRDLVPKTELEYALYRRVKERSTAQQKQMLRDWSKPRRG